MLQLILHLTGDYILQTDWMAKNKRSSSLAAYAHAVTYSLPFVAAPVFLNALLQFCGKAPQFDKTSTAAFLVILVTHFFIDRFGLARYVVFAKNRITDDTLKMEDCPNGYHKDDPPWLTNWLTIAADNTIHLWINFLALLCL